MSALHPESGHHRAPRARTAKYAARKRRTFVLSFLIWIKSKFVADKLPCNLRKGPVPATEGNFHADCILTPDVLRFWRTKWRHSRVRKSYWLPRQLGRSAVRHC